MLRSANCHKTNTFTLLSEPHGAENEDCTSSRSMWEKVYLARNDRASVPVEAISLADVSPHAGVNGEYTRKWTVFVEIGKCKT